MFTGNEDQFVSLSAAANMTKNYRDANPDQVLGGYISKKTLMDILNQNNCVGIRYYYAADKDGAKELVVTGVDSAENDLYQGLIGDKSFKSPPYKGANNVLNS